ncbi:WecB/TagA/CpsF family glycosyltransferase [bacterium]|nr:WecB/TagA/CpsF family glycosyltransferase [bacterium]
MERTLVKLQGLPVDTFTFEEALKYAAGISGQIVTINPEMIACAKKNPDFKSIIENAELIIPDGIGVEIGLKILGKRVKRMAGIEFARALLAEFSKTSQPVALVGAKEEIITKARENLEKEINGINIVYSHNGYFKEDEIILKELANSNPRYVLVALGSPKQEEFINKAKQLMPDALLIGVGGSFDVWSGVVDRAPEIYQKMGVEWLYRTVKEPKRFKRIFPTLPLFVLNVLKEKFIGV